MVASGQARSCHIVIEADEVKNQTRLEFELPPRSAALLRLYLERYQPLLGTCPSSWLFPGRYGKAKNASGMSVQIADTVFSATGIKMHVHLFRHVGAMLYLERNPGGYEVLRRILRPQVGSDDDRDLLWPLDDSLQPSISTPKSWPMATLPVCCCPKGGQIAAAP